VPGVFAKVPASVCGISIDLFRVFRTSPAFSGTGCGDYTRILTIYYRKITGRKLSLVASYDVHSWFVHLLKCPAMRGFVLPVILLLLAFDANAQKKLKYDIIKETGDTLFRSSEERIYTKAGTKPAIGEYLKTTVYKSKNGFSLCFSIQTGRTNIFTISKSTAATIQLEDGTAVTVYSKTFNQSKNSVMGYGCYMFAFYDLPYAARQKLQSSNIKTITLQASVGEMYYEIKGKFGDTIAQQISAF
jgi:hypothetical protein